MKKLLIIFLLLTVCLSTVNAWRWETHEAIVESVYYSLEPEIREKLNLTLMKQGSVVPDKYFKDNVLHHYPPSYDLAKMWLNLAKTSYQTGQYGNSSYAFGVASHYIDDSFVSPHYISKEPWNLHAEFEKQAHHDLTTKCKKYNYDLEKEMNAASLNGKHWAIWLKTKDEQIPRQQVEDSLSLLYAVGTDIFQSNCYKGDTDFEKVNLPGSYKSTISIGTLVLALVLLQVFKKKFKK